MLGTCERWWGERNGARCVSRRELAQPPSHPPSILAQRELVQRAAEIVNTSLSLGSGIPRCIDRFSITGPPDNAARLASKHRVDYLSTDRLTELRNSRDSGSSRVRLSGSVMVPGVVCRCSAK